MRVEQPADPWPESRRQHHLLVATTHDYYVTYANPECLRYSVLELLGGRLCFTIPFCFLSRFATHDRL